MSIAIAGQPGQIVSVLTGLPVGATHSRSWKGFVVRSLGFQPRIRRRLSNPLTARILCRVTRSEQAQSGTCGDAISLRQQRPARQAPSPTAPLQHAAIALANLTRNSTVYKVRTV